MAVAARILVFAVIFAHAMSADLCAAAGAVHSRPTVEDLRQTLLAEYGVLLQERADGLPWTIPEAETIYALLHRLPRALQHLALESRFREIALLKAGRVPRTVVDHVAPPLFYWQVELELRGASTSEELQILQSSFIHHWLHVLDSREHISNSTGWRSLSGWRSREYFGVTLPLLRKEADNQDPRGYASERGLTSPEEDFATFGEVFFLTPDSTVEDSIACRTPDKYRFFREQFPDFRPYLDRQNVRCRTPGEGFLDDLTFFDPVTRLPIAMGPVDAKSVRGFELLYATPGVGDAAEVAGHLVLRVRLANNPDADRNGVENPQDLVISFLADTDDHAVERAAVADLKAPPTHECKESWFNLGREGQADFDAIRAVLQALKGLNGGFLTTFDRQTLAQTVKSYTVDQDRNLLRYELKLSEEQKSKLIDRLFIAKKNYKSKYYFFDRNCASILIQLIGEGIGDAEVANFDPFVVPPNALVALLIRKGLAEPKTPAFYSYRKKGHLAQEMLKERLVELTQKAPKTNWPRPDDLTAKGIDVRLKAFELLGKVALHDQRLAREIYPLGVLGQEAELVQQDHAQRCENFTSPVEAAIRDWQRQLLIRDPDLAAADGFDTNRRLATANEGAEREFGRLGSGHTNLSTVSFGVGSTIRLGGALHRQDLGARSAQAMQRATFVELGRASVDFAPELGGGPRGWLVSGLSLRKFKERLDTVPSFFGAYGTFGLGLSLMQLGGTPSGDRLFGSLVGGELLFNLTSTSRYDSFVFASIGGAVDLHRGDDFADAGDDGRSRLRLAVPVRIEGLWTIDSGRRWQARASVEERPSMASGRWRSEISGKASLDWLAGEAYGSELVLRFAGDNSPRYRNVAVPVYNRVSDAANARAWLLELEVNRW